MLGHSPHLCPRRLRNHFCLRRIYRIRCLCRLHHLLPRHCRLHLFVIANTLLSRTLLCLCHTNAKVWLRARPCTHRPHMQRGRRLGAEIAPD